MIGEMGGDKEGEGENRGRVFRATSTFVHNHFPPAPPPPLHVEETMKVCISRNMGDTGGERGGRVGNRGGMWEGE